MDALLLTTDAATALSGLSFFSPAVAAAADLSSAGTAAETITPAAGLSFCCYCAAVETAAASAASARNNIVKEGGVMQMTPPFYLRFLKESGPRWDESGLFLLSARSKASLTLHASGTGRLFKHSSSIS